MAIFIHIEHFLKLYSIVQFAGEVNCDRTCKNVMTLFPDTTMDAHMNEM